MMKKIFVLVFTFIIVLPAWGEAAPRVGINGAVCAYETIQAAVAAASSGDTIQVSKGTYNEDVDIISKNLTVSGGYDSNCTAAGSGDTTVNGGGSESVFDISESVVTLQSLRITGGGLGTAIIGGGVDGVSNSQVTLDHTDVFSNTGTYGGGAYLSDGSQLTLIQSNIYNNTATITGGGVRVWGTLISNDTSGIFNNSAPNGGGISVASTGIVQLNGTEVYQNQASAADGKGGGIHVDGGQITLSGNASIQLNEAYDGGGIYAGDGTVSLTGVTLDQNTSGNEGGAVYLTNSSSLNASNTKFSENEAAYHGGAVSSYNSTLVIDADYTTCDALSTQCSSFHQNKADSDGNASGYGGAIYSSDSSLTMDHTYLHHNSAVRGGAIYQEGAGAAAGQVYNSLLYANSVSAPYGAGIRKQSGTFSMTHVTLADNTGGAGCSGVIDEAFNCIAWGNSAGGFATTPTDSGCNIDQSGDAGSVTDPLFVSPGAGEDYHLQKGSPAINACSSGLPRDIENRVRGHWDMGAYESKINNDSNADGRSDILLRNATTGQHTLWYMQTDGTHSGKALLTNSDFTIASAGDINGDGISDILWNNTTTGQKTAWYMNADGTRTGKSLLTNSAWSIAATGDINGDGSSDILWTNTSTGQHTVWYMKTDGSHTSKTLLNNPAWRIAGTGDINADGNADILWSNTSGLHVLWLMITDGTHTSKTLLDNTAWAIAGTGDINGDGKSEILWRKASTGDVLLWFMNADGTRASYKTLLTNPDWTVASTGDVNKDGRDDIVWRKASTGDILLWFMNADGTRASYKTLLTNPDWTIVP